jgi:hypothetical protein
MHRELSALELRDAQIDNNRAPAGAAEDAAEVCHPAEISDRRPAIDRAASRGLGAHLSRERPGRAAANTVQSLGSRRSFASSVTVAAPSGWKLTPSESKSLEKPFCTATVESRLEQRKLKLESKLTQRTGQFPAADYRAFNDAMSSALGLVERNVVFKKGE